jgi:hypothetical protein
MPVYDPRQHPALERAMPADTPRGDDGSWRADDTMWEVEFKGGAGWRPVTARAWWRDRFGREVVQMDWYAGEAWSGAFLADWSMMRRL